MGYVLRPPPADEAVDLSDLSVGGFVKLCFGSPDDAPEPYKEPMWVQVGTISGFGADRKCVGVLHNDPVTTDKIGIAHGARVEFTPAHVWFASRR